MALIPLENAGETGIVQDIQPWQLPINAWSDGNNVRMEHGSVFKCKGYSSVMETCPIAPYHIGYVKASGNKYWIACGLAAIHVFDATEKTTTLDGGIGAAATGITVDSVIGFETAGTITIGSEDIPYTGISTNTFTGCVRGGGATTHLDGATVTRTKKWYDITRGGGAGGAYSATAAETWASTVIGGVLVVTNGVDEPQFWELVDGVPATIQKMQNLTNWPAVTECKSMRAFRSFLVSLNITASNVNFPRVVKWSTEAAIQTVPSSWNEADAAVDAGEYELADTKGAILDGLPLRDSFMIYKEDAVYSMTYVGTPFIFSFRQLSPSVGILSKNCVAEFDGGHFLFGNGDIYLNDGQRITSLLPHKMRDHVFALVDGGQIEKSFVVADYGRTEMLACFVSTSSGADNQCDKALIWNWVNNTFSIRDIPNLAHMGYGSVKNELAYTTWTAAAALPPSPAGPSWSAAIGAWAVSWEDVENVLLFADPVSTKLYRDGSGNKEDTTDMVSYVERTGLTFTSQNQPDQSTVKRIKAIWPKMTIASSDTVNFYIGTQMSTEEAITWSSPITFNPDSQSKVSCRASGKLYGIKIESTGDTSWRLDGLEFELDDAGRRGSRSY